MQGGKRHNMNTPYNATNLNEYMYLYIRYIYLYGDEYT